MRMTEQTFSRAISVATLGYGVYALVRPEHLGRVMESDAFEKPTYDRLARAYGVRDTVIGALGLLGPTPTVVRTAMALRIAGDLADTVVLGMRAPNGRVRTKVLAVTLGYAAVNAAALARDARRS